MASSKGWIIKGKGKLHELESESRDLAHIATQLVAVARPDAEENFMNQGGANWYLMNSRQSISHLMTEPLLAERMGLPADFGFEHHLLSTLVFEDVTVEAPHHGNYFGLLLLFDVSAYPLLPFDNVHKKRTDASTANALHAHCAESLFQSFPTCDASVCLLQPFANAVGAASKEIVLLLLITKLESVTWCQLAF